MWRNKGIAAVAVGFLASCATTDSKREDPILYEARGDRWDLRITASSIRLRERVGRGSFDYYGPVPPLVVEADGVRFEGELLRQYVIARHAEEDSRSYAIEIAERPCRDRRGRLWSTNVSFNFFSEYNPSGCGGSTVRLRRLQHDTSR